MQNAWELNQEILIHPELYHHVLYTPRRNFMW